MGNLSHFAKKELISYEKSSPCNQRANRLAELAAETVTSMLEKSFESGQDVNRALDEWRNLQHNHRHSPS